MKSQNNGPFDQSATTIGEWLGCGLVYGVVGIVLIKSLGFVGIVLVSAGFASLFM